MQGSIEGLQRLLRHFPSGSYTFAYGSAVFPQKNQQTGKMVDLIFVVDNPMKWHAENLSRNSRHYSFLKYFGTGTIVKIQETWAAGVYYNTLIKVENQLLKYGVISTQTLLDDLKNWTHAYISGRLHKPVLDLSPPSNSQLVKAVKMNRLSALRTVLLQLPTQSSKWDLYHGITELSYFGDSRMRLGENPNKVGNILAGNLQRFDDIYQPLIRELKPLIEGSSDTIIQDTSSEARLNHLLHLPFYLQRRICRESGRDPALHDVEEVMVEISSLPALAPLVRKALGNIVWKSSVLQTAQGILTAGPFKAIYYGLEKVKKKISGSKESSSPPETKQLSPPTPAVESTKPKVENSEKKVSQTNPTELLSTPLYPSDPEPKLQIPENEIRLGNDSVQSKNAPNLSDLDFPFFPMKRPAQESTEVRVGQGLITVKVKEQEKQLLNTKAQIRTPPIFTKEPSARSTEKCDDKVSVSSTTIEPKSR